MTAAALPSTTASSSTSGFTASAPHLSAAGDVANFRDVLYGRRRRIERWSNANYQGTDVRKVLTGQAGGYETVSSFYSEVFGTTIKVFGDTTQVDELREDGDLTRPASSLAMATKGRLVGVISVGQSEELEALVKDLINERARATPERELAGRSR